MRTCNTGGAVGSDQAWQRCATHYRWGVQILSFVGHSLYKNWEGDLLQLSDQELEQFDPLLHKVNETLHRNFPTDSSYVNRLLRRNGAIIQHVEQVVGVGILNKTRTIAQGGTGWGIQMGIDLGLQVFMFEQQIEQWFTWMQGEFVPGFSGQSPPLADKFAGIGTRRINRAGIIAIRECCGRQHSNDN